jgi:hypothetical protein
MQVFSSDDGYDSGNLLLGTLAGAVAALLAALAWAGITAATNFQIGFMAIGVGIAVAYAVRLVGRGHDGKFAIASGVLSLLGCLAGNFLAVVFGVAAHDHASYLAVFVGLLPHVVDVFQQTFNFMDLIFYAIGIYYGYRYATVPLRPRPVVVPEQAP